MDNYRFPDNGGLFQPTTSTGENRTPAKSHDNGNRNLQKGTQGKTKKKTD